MAVACALALWELVVGIGLLNEDHVPSMTATVAELADLLGDGDFWTAVGSTLQGWALGLGIAAAARDPARDPDRLEPCRLPRSAAVIEFLRPIPSVALMPLAVLIYGTGLESKVFLAAFASFWPLFVQTLYGVQDVDPVATDTARSFGLGRFERLLADQAAERGAVHRHRPADLVRGRADPRRHGRDRDRRARPGPRDQRRARGRRIELMYALIITTGLLGWLLNILTTQAERRVLHWHPSQREAGR